MPSKGFKVNLSEYRPGVGALIINKNKDILIFARVDGLGWQLPQGGLEPDEDIKDCLFREILEETGIDKENLALLAETKDFISYDIPAEYNCELHGQSRKWFLLEFAGTDADIKLDAFAAPEFSAFKWGSKSDVMDAVVWFKKDMYIAMFNEFDDYLKKD
jgi:putative (di)nucleoside polyphosphate hydrolase